LCNEWVDPETPSYVLQISAQGSFYFHYDYTPNNLEFLSAPYLGLLELGANFTKIGVTDSEDPKLINDGCLAMYPDDWWQVDFPGESYHVSGFTIKRRESLNGEQTITAVKFEVRRGGEWQSDGKWYPTGLLPQDDQFTERRISIDPPLKGNLFRVVLDE
jgi:hypothetical protein